MSIDWGRFRTAKNTQEISKMLLTAIRPDNYGKGDGEWCRTELINERSAAAAIARRYVEGVKNDGSISESGPMRSKDGLEFTVRLKVLSRQACTEDADGHGINTWDTTEVEKENFNREWCPQVDDKPLQGDKVWVKGNAYTHDPETGEPLTKKFRLALKARVEARMGRAIKPALATHRHSKYPVDADGCITVPYITAVQLLSLKGRGLVLPQFKSGASRGNDKETRQITNWLFEESCDEPQPKKKK